MLVGQSYDEGWGACDRIRLMLAAGLAAAANHNSLTRMHKGDECCGHKRYESVWYAFVLLICPALKSLPSSSLQMQLHPMISTEIQTHTSPVRNALLAQLSLVES